MYIIYVNNTLPLALAVHEISRHFWAAYALTTNSHHRPTQGLFLTSHVRQTSTYLVISIDIHDIGINRTRDVWQFSQN